MNEERKKRDGTLGLKAGEAEQDTKGRVGRAWRGCQGQGDNWRDKGSREHDEKREQRSKLGHHHLVLKFLNPLRWTKEYLSEGDEKGGYIHGKGK